MGFAAAFPRMDRLDIKTLKRAYHAGVKTTKRKSKQEQP